MKRLILIRHAKSDWSEPELKDFDRSLNARGKRDAPVMADKLFSKYSKADALISSPAKRALTTAKVFFQRYEKSVLIERSEIYEARYLQLIQLINSFDDKWNTVILFGHNPGFSDLASMLSGQNIELPTCAMAALEFDFKNWELISAETGKLVYFNFPKNVEQ
jgi:phosphohistidine phosphatase